MPQLFSRPHPRVTMATALLVATLVLAGCSTRADPAASDPNLTTFVNSKADLIQPLLDHYVDFSFQHPKSWKVVRAQKNFVHVEQAITYKKLGDCTVENLTVGGFWVTGAQARPDRLMRTLAELAAKIKMSDGDGQQPRDYKKESEGPTTIAGIKGYEYRYSCRLGDPGDDVACWGRNVILPHPSGEGDGLVLMMMVSGALPAVTSAADVGEKGELPILLKSFRVGK